MSLIPAPLAQTSARALEYDSLRDLLRGYTGSDLGRARVNHLAPSTDRGWIERQQQLTAEIRQYLRVGGRFDFSGLHDPTKLVEKSRIQGAALEPGEIRDVVALVDRAAEWLEIAVHPPSAMRPVDRLQSHTEASIPFHANPHQHDWSERVQETQSGGTPWPTVAALSFGIVDFTEFLRAFRNKINPDGTLDDRASSELARIRRDIDKQKRQIQESLRSYVRRLSEADVAQEELVTIRGERFVIPVKAEQKRRVDGVVHGVSSSGQTVFVEPLETIEQNNELVRLMEEEQAEIHRILREMTVQLARHADAIFVATEVMGELDLQFAKARYAQDYNCAPVLLTEGALYLHDARHPLLERNMRARGGKVVPISVELGTDAPSPAEKDAAPHPSAIETGRQLIISGPNTGGKTVTLKTIGILALMAQSGIPVPAGRAELPVFDAVLADIGDYQSIEQNLSTFSAHVTNLDRISRIATSRSLVLLDELGSATDPEEGAALAVAIADHFRRVGAMTIISTHLTSLKVYAANNPGVVNAAVGFNERTLQPTYELRVGVPGASAGIGIAQRLGLNMDIVEAARARLGSQTQDISRFLDKLHDELRQIESERARLESAQQQLALEKSRLEAEGLRERRMKIREMEKKLESVLRDFEFRARETVNLVQDRAAALKLSKESERRIAKLRREFREQFDQTVVAHHTGADQGDQQAQPHVVKNVTVGDTVKLKSLGRTGMVTRHNEDDSFEVQVGIMKMKVGRDDIAEVFARVSSGTPVQAARSKGISVSLAREDESAPTEINVIGHTVDDATREVEKFIDRAFLAGISNLRIVHGSGMGILRKAIRQYLRSHPHVANITEPPQNLGGAGATEVELKN
ncbi:MAG TPA: Smr/MutS family protein [Terriglobales bacterium]|nr:Smr/MutS family protein [Terriglobales bacterium]